MSQINWKIGCEIELLAPKGLSRKDLAESIAQLHHGSVRRIFYPQSEPSKVPGKPLFHNLTLGFEVVNKKGHLIAKCVDDLTLQDDLNKSHPSKPRWYRIVSDDTRFLQLIIAQANPEKSKAEVLKPIADLFGTVTEEGSGGMVRVADNTGLPIAIAAPLPGERERPCELITPPISTNHLEKLEVILHRARLLNFNIPVEGATHLHFDAVPLCSANVFANLVNIFHARGENLKRLVGTNPYCRRLGSWDIALFKLVNESGFRQLSWEQAVSKIAKLELSKYCDFNIKNLIHPIPDKFTFEARIFPAWLYAKPIVEAAALFEAILYYSINTSYISPHLPIKWELQSVKEFIKLLPISENFREIWLSRAENIS
ncbi:Putative amidoligase enzyme [Rivularia sp. PCC 7116]|uniref:amidoligase family protein n=1 Tax=Rivularia sp. PCC 7116 TaxID=373994 RepID=UPI00029F0F23|nr:amidoligase family protein [Rivularia sp. PCC 7116]AFY54892.1 Putative amidoligase enzyme [Rivularia sp. PCC 7116]